MTSERGIISFGNPPRPLYRIQRNGCLESRVLPFAPQGGMRGDESWLEPPWRWVFMRVDC